MAPQQQPEGPEGGEQPPALGTAPGADVPAPPGEAASAGDADPEAGERRAAELAALRAEEIAATEGFHPLRVRPYVAGPGDGGPAPTPDGPASPDQGEPTAVLPPVPADPDDAGDPGEPTTALTPLLWSTDTAGADLGLLPAPHEQGPYEDGDGGHEAGALPYPDEDEAAAIRGRHRRRRRRIVVAAAAVAASALAAGAVAVTGQMVNEDKGSDLTLPDQTTSVPDVKLPAELPTAASHAAPPATRFPPAPPATSTPGASPSASASPSATTATATATGSVGSPSPSATPSGSPSTTPPVTSSPPPAPTAPATPLVLQLGDTGPAVADLQRRLAQVWAYHGRDTGTFDRRTEDAVTTFQVWYGVHGDPSGVYGPNTRAALERATSPSSGSSGSSDQ